MRRPARVGPLLLLLAAMASPAAGSPRPLESLRLVVSVGWLSDETAPQSTPVVQAARACDVATSPSPVLRASDSPALSTAIQRARFQRPPPRLRAL